MMNGIEAMREVDDRPRVLMLKSQLGNDREVAVSVEDTGAGVDPAQLGHIFEAFFTTKAEGLGMGLSICHSIVRGTAGGCQRLPAHSVVPSFASRCLLARAAA